MIKKNSIFDFLGQIMVAWGISTLSLCLFCFLFGKSAKGYSSIFALGNMGISISTLMQFFCLSMILTILRWIFFTDIVIKKLSILLRSIFMFAGIIVSVGIFAAACHWFPVDEVVPWILFLVCFFVCAAVSILVSVLKERSDNKKMQAALTHMLGED